LTGNTAQLLKASRVIAQTRAYSLTGANVNLSRAIPAINAIVGQFNLSSANAKLVSARVLRAIVGDFDVTGMNAELSALVVAALAMLGDHSIYSLFTGESDVIRLFTGEPDVIPLFAGTSALES
jgi:hypothetical protein